MVVQSKNTGNPDGLPSILMWQKQKLTFENRGSDNFCHPKRRALPRYISVFIFVTAIKAKKYLHKTKSPGKRNWSALICADSTKSPYGRLY